MASASNVTATEEVLDRPRVKFLASDTNQVPSQENCWSSAGQFMRFTLQLDVQYDLEAPRIQVIVGICAMEKKSLSKPMKEILSRIGEFEYIKTVIFPEDVIVNVSSTRKLLLYVI